MQTTSNLLNTSDHSRDSIGMTYIYPVVSRRAGGVSVGINLNPNNACNWRCIYCQVPNLTRGAAPKIELIKLETELRTFLNELIHENFMQKHVPIESRNIHDIALSGNGEPTSAKEFAQIIQLIGQVMHDFNLPQNLKLVLITNGSLINRPTVQDGLAHMAKLNGEIWFKFDSATDEGRNRINNSHMSQKHVRENLRLAASFCPTWLQTCVFQMNGKPPIEEETNAYVAFVESVLKESIPIKGVLLYGIERPSLQPEAPQLTKVSESWFNTFGKRIESLGLTVKFNY